MFVISNFKIFKKMKKIFYTFILILFANIGYSQFLPTGTSTTDNKYRSGGLGVGFLSAPTSFGSNKFMVDGQSQFLGGVRISIFSDKVEPQFQIAGALSYADNNAFQIGIAGGDWHWSNISKKGDVVLRAMTTGSLIITNEGKGSLSGTNEEKKDIRFVTKQAESGVSKTAMLIDKYGKVGIGENISIIPTTVGGQSVANYRLFVKGGILTEEVRVMLTNQWADYVFENEYKLLKLEELEEFIENNKHLPNVPSAKEVRENGIELGAISKIQQENIEELTLYIIEQNKTNKEQQKEIDELKAQMKAILGYKEE